MVRFFTVVYTFFVSIYRIATTSLVELGAPILSSFETWLNDTIGGVLGLTINVDLFRKSYNMIVTFFGFTDGTLVGFIFGSFVVFAVFTIIKWVIDLIF